MQSYRSERPVQTVENRPDITWTREERHDIDISGYKRYLYQFGNPDAEDKEISHCIISAPTMDEAIAFFMDQVRGPDWYEGACINVEVIGIDVRPDGSPVWLTE